MRDTERQTRRREFRARETRQSPGQARTGKELRDPWSAWRIHFFRWLPDKKKLQDFKVDWPPNSILLGDLEIFLDMDLANI